MEQRQIPDESHGEFLKEDAKMLENETDGRRRHVALSAGFPTIPPDGEVVKADTENNAAAFNG